MLFRGWTTSELSAILCRNERFRPAREGARPELQERLLLFYYLFQFLQKWPLKRHYFTKGLPTFQDSSRKVGFLHVGTEESTQRVNPDVAHGQA